MKTPTTTRPARSAATHTARCKARAAETDEALGAWMKARTEEARVDAGWALLAWAAKWDQAIPAPMLG